MMDRPSFDAMCAEVAADGEYLLDMIANAAEVAALADGTVGELLAVMADDIAAQAVAVDAVEVSAPQIEDAVGEAA